MTVQVSENKKGNTPDEKKVTIKNPVGQAESRVTSTPRAELLRLLLEASGVIEKTPDVVIKPGKDFVVTEEEYKKLRAGSKDVVISGNQEETIRKFFKDHKSHEDKAKISDEDIKKLSTDLKVGPNYKIAEYSNFSSDIKGKPYTMQRLTLLEPSTGENLVILSNGIDNNKLSINKNFGFAAFKGYEKELVELILKADKDFKKLPTGTLENAELKFEKGKVSEKFDTIKLTFPNLGQDNKQNIAFSLLFIKDTTLLLSVNREEAKANNPQFPKPIKK